MVRFLRCRCVDFESRHQLQRFLVIERVIALLHIPAAICLAVASLADVNVVPYASNHTYHLVFVSALYFVLANGRDAHGCVRDFFIGGNRGTSKWEILGDEKGGEEEEEERNDVVIGGGRGEYVVVEEESRMRGNVEGLMQMFAAVMMTIGSLSLLNSSILGLCHGVNGGGGKMVLARRQYALGFGLLLVGAAGNNVASERGAREVNGTRVLLSFQNVVMSACYGMSGMLMLPELQSAGEGREVVLGVMNSVGGTVGVVCAVMTYFHVEAFGVAQMEYWKRRRRGGRGRGKVKEDGGDRGGRGYVKRIVEGLRRGTGLLGGGNGAERNEEERRREGREEIFSLGDSSYGEEDSLEGSAGKIEPWEEEEVRGGRRGKGKRGGE